MRSGNALILATSYTEALEAALGAIVARAQADLARINESVEVIVAARLAEFETKVTARLAELKDGKDGRDGTDGQPGERGERGPQGEFPIVAQWSDRVHYSGEIVTYEGHTWQARVDTGRAPPDATWHCLARGGNDGRSFNVRGTFDAAESYAALDVVALNGASFVARRASPGACPGEGWQMVAAQGKRGNPGERGAAAKGERGMPGPAATALEINEDGLLTLTNADGSRVTCDLYPLLAKLL
jgi:hypothetical protein